MLRRVDLRRLPWGLSAGGLDRVAARSHRCGRVVHWWRCESSCLRKAGADALDVIERKGFRHDPRNEGRKGGVKSANVGAGVTRSGKSITDAWEDGGGKGVSTQAETPAGNRWRASQSFCRTRASHVSGTRRSFSGSFWVTMKARPISWMPAATVRQKQTRPRTSCEQHSLSSWEMTRCWST